MNIVKKIEEQIKVIKTMREDMETLDFKSSCETLDNLLRESNQVELPHSIYRQWGIVGGESMEELEKYITEWLSHVEARGKDEV